MIDYVTSALEILCVVLCIVAAGYFVYSLAGFAAGIGAAAVVCAIASAVLQVIDRG